MAPWQKQAKGIGTIAGTFFILVGLVWSAQGANLVGGSFMTGQTQWLVFGIVAVVFGLAVLIWARLLRA